MLQSLIYVPFVLALIGPAAPGLDGIEASCIEAIKEASSAAVLDKAASEQTIKEADAIYLDAVKLIKGEKYQEAVVKLKEVLKILPNFAEGYMAYGMVLDKMGNEKEAITQFKMSVAIKPGLAPAWINLASVHQKVGNLKAAVEDLEKYLELRPDAANAASIRKHIELLKEKLSADSKEDNDSERTEADK